MSRFLKIIGGAVVLALALFGTLCLLAWAATGPLTTSAKPIKPVVHLVGRMT